jgi:XTP/dITP diphosphohydrolase
LKVLIATTNKGKIQEFNYLLEGLDIEVIGLAEYGTVPSVEEDGQTYAENALKKARTMHQLTGLPVIADDSGLEVDSLQGRPGIFSARFAGPDASDEDNNRKLLALLGQTPNRQARFMAAVVFVDNGVEEVFTGTIEGTIAHHPAGSEGFGYDPVFIPEGYAQTFAEIGTHIKNKISHRAKAMEKLKNYLSSVLPHILMPGCQV